jgi:hypothetical protein
MAGRAPQVNPRREQRILLYEAEQKAAPPVPELPEPTADETLVAVLRDVRTTLQHLRVEMAVNASPTLLALLGEWLDRADRISRSVICLRCRKSLSWTVCLGRWGVPMRFRWWMGTRLRGGWRRRGLRRLWSRCLSLRRFDGWFSVSNRVCFGCGGSVGCGGLNGCRVAFGRACSRFVRVDCLAVVAGSA